MDVGRQDTSVLTSMTFGRSYTCVQCAVKAANLFVAVVIGLVKQCCEASE